jgi:hypothetical protein
VTAKDGHFILMAKHAAQKNFENINILRVNPLTRGFKGKPEWNILKKPVILCPQITRIILLKHQMHQVRQIICRQPSGNQSALNWRFVKYPKQDSTIKRNQPVLS